MEKYNIGDLWWVHFPFDDRNEEKRRPAIIIDNETMAIMAMQVTSQLKKISYYVEIEDWEVAGLSRPSMARIDKIVKISEWYISRKIGSLSDRDFLKVTQLSQEYLSGIKHDFSLIAVQNQNDDYLQRYDERWKCWLFPYVKSTDSNKENVDTYISELLGIEIETRYISTAIHCKYSVSDDRYKVYNHKLYGTLISDTDIGKIAGDESALKWMSMKEMENNDDIMSKNDEVLAFVKSNFEQKK